MSRQVTSQGDRGPRGPRIVSGRVPGRGARRAGALACGLALLQIPGRSDAVAAAADSLHKLVVVWPEVTMLVDSGRVRDVSFATPGLNIVNAVEMAWCADAASHALIAVATKPIAGTAAAGEEIGRTGTDAVDDPAALFVGTSEQVVLEQEPALVVLRAGKATTFSLAPVNGPERDVAVGPTGMIYVLLGSEIRVYADVSAPPLWTVPVPRQVAPAAAIAVTAGGGILVAGDGTTALARLELGRDGAFHQTASRSARELEVGRPSGIALTPALLVELPDREGWVGRDRFVLLADAQPAVIVALEASTLEPVGRLDLAAELPGVVPGRIDVSNRAQIAIADAASGQALALPARLFADLIEKTKIRWKSTPRDSTAGEAGP